MLARFGGISSPPLGIDSHGEVLAGAAALTTISHKVNFVSATAIPRHEILVFV